MTVSGDEAIVAMVADWLERSQKSLLYHRCRKMKRKYGCSSQDSRDMETTTRYVLHGSAEEFYWRLAESLRYLHTQLARYPEVAGWSALSQHGGHHGTRLYAGLYPVQVYSLTVSFSLIYPACPLALQGCV